MFPIDEVVSLLRREACLGRKPSEMLRLLRNYPEARSTLPLVFAFRRAFLVPLTELGLIGGWSSDGIGEISDARIDETLRPAIEATRHLWDQEPGHPG